MFDQASTLHIHTQKLLHTHYHCLFWLLTKRLNNKSSFKPSLLPGLLIKQHNIRREATTTKLQKDCSDIVKHCLQVCVRPWLKSSFVWAVWRHLSRYRSGEGSNGPSQTWIVIITVSSCSHPTLTQLTPNINKIITYNYLSSQQSSGWYCISRI